MARSESTEADYEFVPVEAALHGDGFAELRRKPALFQTTPILLCTGARKEIEPRRRGLQ